MNTENFEKFREFYLNYKSAYTISAEFQMNGIKHPINLEVRKGGKIGCEVFTIINRETHHLFSRLLRGCIYKLILELPLGASLAISHTVFVEANNIIKPLLIIEEIFRETSVNTPRPLTENALFIILSCTMNGNSIRTRAYESDEIYGALDELKVKLGEEISAIRICPYCRFIEQYANTNICLRDLTPDEFTQAQNMEKRQKNLEIYFEKIAWDIDEFHFCSAFTRM